jgi:hypothetical protein
VLIVVAYDPTWPQRLQAASAEILAVADHLFLRLEHIGSTSVPGLAAKPTIDMMASVRRLLDGHAAQPALAALGYELDELGYVQLDPRGAELLFQIITEREERASIAIGTNLPFSEWGTCSPTPPRRPPSSTGSPSTPTSSRPAPSPTGSPPARPAIASGPASFRARVGR